MDRYLDVKDEKKHTTLYSKLHGVEKVFYVSIVVAAYMAIACISGLMWFFYAHYGQIQMFLSLGNELLGNVHDYEEYAIDTVEYLTPHFVDAWDCIKCAIHHFPETSSCSLICDGAM